MEKFLALRRNYLAAEVHTSVEEANQAPDINIRSQRSMDTVEEYIHFCRHNPGKPPTHLRFPKRNSRGAGGQSSSPLPGRAADG